VISRPGLRPRALAALADCSERTLYRDLASLRRMGYSIVFSDGYRVQESLSLDGGGGARGLATVYEEQVRLLREEAPALAGLIEAEVDTEAPAALASLFARAIGRHLRHSR
jgi:predicted DNA-binding transcriptional regulator YafY